MVNSDRTGKPYVAIAVSDPSRRSEAANCLRSLYRFSEYPDTSRALAGCRACVPRLVLVCEKLSPGGGFDFVRAMQLDPVLAAIPVLMPSIIDIFSALTDRRVYKAPMDPETALALMVNEMASKLDMRLLALFRQMLLDAT